MFYFRLVRLHFDHSQKKNLDFLFFAFCRHRSYRGYENLQTPCTLYKGVTMDQFQFFVFSDMVWTFSMFQDPYKKIIKKKKKWQFPIYPPPYLSSPSANQGSAFLGNLPCLNEIDSSLPTGEIFWGRFDLYKFRWK